MATSGRSVARSCHPAIRLRERSDAQGGDPDPRLLRIAVHATGAKGAFHVDDEDGVTLQRPEALRRVRRDRAGPLR
jgi:hypothetical protein